MLPLIPACIDIHDHQQNIENRQQKNGSERAEYYSGSSWSDICPVSGYAI